MAVYKLFPIKDTTLYSQYNSMNTGIDPINQVSNLNIAINSSPTVARTLTQFDTDDIQNVLENIVTGSWDAHLKSFIATAQGINEAAYLYIAPVSESWNNGTGTYLDQPMTTDGASWGYRGYAGGPTWNMGDQVISTSSYNPLYSYQGGGNWYISSSTNSSPSQILYPYSQSFGMRSEKDLDVRVTETIHDWYSSSIDNSGFIIRWEDNIEFTTNTQIQPVMQYYSVDTNTIYPPQLEIRWDDFIWATSSTIGVLDQPNAFISLAENPGVFYSESVNRFRLNCRPKYPTRVWSTSSLYTKQYYLPSGSTTYAVKDLDTDEYVIDFDGNYTQVSADVTSSYFDIYMNGLEPERYYKVLIQVTAGGSTTVYDDNYYFKVING